MKTQSQMEHTSLSRPSAPPVLEQSETLIAVGLSANEEPCLHYLQSIGYVVQTHASIEGLREQISYQIPNVLLLDMDHLQERAIVLTKQLKESPLTYTMPIIIVLGRKNEGDEICALDAGAEDYVVKPILPKLLATRIRNCMRRNIRLQISNPLTGLPGTTYIEEQATKRLAQNQPTAMSYVDIVEFKAFNDKYGYTRGDTVIQLLANILNEVVAAYGSEGDFVGHIGGDDFILISHPDHVEQMCQYVIECFDTLIPFQYDPEDMENEYIVSKNRQGEERFFPLMTLSIGVVSNTYRRIDSYLTLTELAAEMKAFCKRVIQDSSERKSRYKMDQRGG